MFLYFDLKLRMISPNFFWFCNHNNLDYCHAKLQGYLLYRGLSTELFQVVHGVDSNHSFSSTDKDSELFVRIFPDSEISKKYRHGYIYDCL